MGYVWLFLGTYAVWVIGSTLLRTMVVTSEPVKDGEFVRILLHAAIAAIIVTLVVFVIRGGQ